jgi:hypothetical protein
MRAAVRKAIVMSEARGDERRWANEGMQTNECCWVVALAQAWLISRTFAETPSNERQQLRDEAREAEEGCIRSCPITFDRKKSERRRRKKYGRVLLGVGTHYLRPRNK